MNIVYNEIDSALLMLIFSRYYSTEGANTLQKY